SRSFILFLSRDLSLFFMFVSPPPPLYTLSLHDALPISGFDLVYTDLTVRTGEALAERQNVPVHSIHHKKAVRQVEHCLNRVRQTFFYSRLHHKTVYNDLYIMLDIFIKFDLFRKFVHTAVDLHAYISAPLRLFQKLRMGSFSSPDHRRQKLDSRSLRKFHDMVHHLVHRLFFYLLAAFRTVGDSDSRIEKTEIIIDLRH